MNSLSTLENGESKFSKIDSFNTILIQINWPITDDLATKAIICPIRLGLCNEGVVVEEIFDNLLTSLPGHTSISNIKGLFDSLFKYLPVENSIRLSLSNCNYLDFDLCKLRYLSYVSNKWLQWIKSVPLLFALLFQNHTLFVAIVRAI